MPAKVLAVILLCLLMSSGCTLKMLSVSQHGPRLLIAKSYGVPVKLSCADRQTIRIHVSGISLFKCKKTEEANHVFPGIYTQSQTECQQTFHQEINTLWTECELSFSGRKIPSDLMIVVVYECVTTSDLEKRLVHTRIAESGDVLLMCDFGKMIDILDIKINETELNGQVQGAIKQRCALKMIQGSLPLDNQTSDARAPTACTVSRQGRNGRLLVKYQCLQTSLKVSGQQQHALLRKRLLVLKKNRDSIPNYFLLFPRKRKQKSN